MNRKQDYTGRSFLITVFVILFLLGISRIPKVTFGKTTLKKINILSDLIQDEHEPIPETNLYFDTTFLAEGEALEAEARAAADPPVVYLIDHEEVEPDGEDEEPII